ncbi:hypothetical protein DFH27DRAFT_528862 [Peziza echinospora]|nr:hypothetical protein DFH27DRAFT_528862 [Peziza echinospora]
MYDIKFCNLLHSIPPIKAPEIPPESVTLRCFITIPVPFKNPEIMDTLPQSTTKNKRKAYSSTPASSKKEKAGQGFSEALIAHQLKLMQHLAKVDGKKAAEFQLKMWAIQDGPTKVFERIQEAGEVYLAFTSKYLEIGSAMHDLVAEQIKTIAQDRGLTVDEVATALEFEGLKEVDRAYKEHDRRLITDKNHIAQKWGAEWKQTFNFKHTNSEKVLSTLKTLSETITLFQAVEHVLHSYRSSANTKPQPQVIDLDEVEESTDKTPVDLLVIEKPNVAKSKDAISILAKGLKDCAEKDTTDDTHTPTSTSKPNDIATPATTIGKHNQNKDEASKNNNSLSITPSMEVTAGELREATKMKGKESVVSIIDPSISAKSTNSITNTTSSNLQRPLITKEKITNAYKGNSTTEIQQSMSAEKLNNDAIACNTTDAPATQSRDNKGTPVNEEDTLLEFESDDDIGFGDESPTNSQKSQLVHEMDMVGKQLQLDDIHPAVDTNTMGLKKDTKRICHMDLVIVSSAIGLSSCFDTATVDGSSTWCLIAPHKAININDNLQSQVKLIAEWNSTKYFFCNHRYYQYAALLFVFC